ncbi:MAG: hypothetical protein QM831_23865 [Kofleriaceae bacterium]
MSRSLLVVMLAACGSHSGDTGDKTDGPLACIEAWTCTAWQTDGASDSATRTCTDQNACGTSSTKPVETATLPALDPDYYECNVEPIVTRGCSMLGCHGTESGRAYRVYARGRLRITGQTLVMPKNMCGNAQPVNVPTESCIGNIECACWQLPQLATERRRSFDSARGFDLDDNGQKLGDSTQALLLREPTTGGGFPHAGISMFQPTDADYTTIKSWLDGATLGHACNSMN